MATMTMRHLILSLMVAATVGVAACSSVTGASSNDNIGANAPQTGLERVPLTITQGSEVHRFTVEVAASEAEQAHGMMFRTVVPEGTGMVFPFNPPRFASFWMKNTLVPLDLLFVRADGTLDRIAENAVPESLEPIGSGGEVIAVLELAGGTSARLGITETAVVRWQGDRIVAAAQ